MLHGGASRGLAGQMVAKGQPIGVVGLRRFHSSPLSQESIGKNRRLVERCAASLRRGESSEAGGARRVLVSVLARTRSRWRSSDLGFAGPQCCHSTRVTEIHEAPARAPTRGAPTGGWQDGALTLAFGPRSGSCGLRRRARPVTRGYSAVPSVGLCAMRRRSREQATERPSNSRQLPPRR